MELSDLKGVGRKTVEQLNEAGIDSLNDLAKSSTDELTDLGGFSESKANRLISRAKENALLVQRGTDVETEYDGKEMRSSGVAPLDEMLGGGFRDGSIVGISGGHDSGKTQLAFHSMVSSVEQAVEDGEKAAAVYIETEKDRYEPKRLKAMSTLDETYDYIIRIPCHGEDQLDKLYSAYNRVQKIPEQFDDIDSVVMVVIDSFSAPWRMSDEYEGRGQFKQRSNVEGSHLKAITTMTERMNCPALLIRQVYGNPDGWSSGMIAYGGEKLNHILSYRLRLKDAEGNLKKVSFSGHSGEGEGECYLSIKEDGLIGYQPDDV